MIKKILFLLCLAMFLSFSPGRATPAALEPRVRYPLHQDLSPELTTLAQRAAQAAPSSSPEEYMPLPRRILPKAQNAQATGAQPAAFDAALQTQPASGRMPDPVISFDGIDNRNSLVPPDPNGDVGPKHYVQWVNVSLAVWELDRANHSAELVLSPVNGNTLWTGFGGACESANDGDPIVLYDHLADRWLASQFALPDYPYGPFYQCIAVSQTADPTKNWYRYEYEWENSSQAAVMNDYPKFGVWPDGYYFTANQFSSGIGDWRGAGVAVFERDKMLAGLPARIVYFDLYPVNENFGSVLPADLDGPPPPTGTPNFFAEVDDASLLPPSDALRIWEFHVDWTNPVSSTFGLNGSPNQILPVAEFTPLCVDELNCLPQPGTSQRIDALGDRLMHRLQYRTFGDYAVLVANHTVDVGGGQAGLRWYELRSSGAHQAGDSWTIHQQGTYTGEGSNSESRWLGSIAMDKSGNIAVGYSVSSNSVYPSIRYVGRLASDPPGVMGQGETVLINGGGSQGYWRGRWGDYSMLSVDPTDDCTFWYTNEYYASSSDIGWRTRIGAFTLPSCGTGGTGVLQGVVSDAVTSAPLVSATVKANAYTAISSGSGVYRFSALPVGVYTATASAYGYQPSAAVTNLNITYTQPLSQNFSLAPIPRVTVSGQVTDGSGHGWPLYARIDITAQGLARSLFTDPASGAYTVSLAQNVTHTFAVQAVSGGYQAVTQVVTPPAGGATHDFSLLASSAPPCAPGYLNENGCPLLAGGGLVAGHVLDANTGLGVNGAEVRNMDLLTETAVTFAVLDDPATGDGFYLLFASQPGSHPFQANAYQYGPDTQTAVVTASAVTTRSFILPAGRLAVQPSSLNISLNYTQVTTPVLALTNTGSLTSSYSLVAVNAPASLEHARGPFAPATRHTSNKRVADLDASAVFVYHPPTAAAWPGGTVVHSFTSGLQHPWGVGLDPAAADLWVSDAGAAGGDDRLHRFLVTGEATAEAIDLSGLRAYYAADAAFNPFTHMLWQSEVGGDNCLVEIDPAGRTLTGRRLCPGFDNPQRGLAFNPLDGSFYSGSWVDGILNHLDAQGRLLDSVDTGLNISGLAFNPVTHHLFVLTNGSQGYDVYVLDTAGQHYPLLGGFDIPGLEGYQQASLEMDCAGRLWTANQVTGMVYQVESGEQAACTWSSVPWLNIARPDGTLSPGAGLPVSVTLDARQGQVGLNQAQIVLAGSTPYPSQVISVVMEVRGYAVVLAPPASAQSGMQGTAVSYSLLITNTGYFTDSYQILIGGDPRWTVQPSTVEVGPLNPGQGSSFQATVFIPTGAGSGETDTALVAARSEGEPTVAVTATLTTRSFYRLYLSLVRRSKD